MTTGTPGKTPFENQHLQSCNYFTIILSSLNSTMLVKYPTSGLHGALLKPIQNSRSLLLS